MGDWELLWLYNVRNHARPTVLCGQHNRESQRSEGEVCRKKPDLGGRGRALSRVLPVVSEDGPFPALEPYWTALLVNAALAEAASVEFEFPNLYDPLPSWSIY